MSGLDTSQAITDEASLNAAAHHLHSLPHDGDEQPEPDEEAAQAQPDEQTGPA